MISSADRTTVHIRPATSSGCVRESTGTFSIAVTPVALGPDSDRAWLRLLDKPVGHRNSIRALANDPVVSPAMLYALLYAIVRRVLRLRGISTDAEAEVLV